MKIPIAYVLTSTLAFTLAAAAPSAHANPFGNMLHMHPHAVTQTDPRVNLTLLNTSDSFREITIEGKTYIIPGHRVAEIKAPVGTLVIAGCGVPLHKKGSVLLEVSEKMNNSTVRMI